MIDETIRRLKAAGLAATVVMLPLAAHAACSVEGKGEVNVLSNSFPAFEAISRAMGECNGDGLKVTFKQSRDHEQEHSVFAGANSPYDMAGVANSSIAPLQAQGLLLPLNELIEKHGAKYRIEDSMKIKFGEEVLAIAFMVNVQHLC